MIPRICAYAQAAIVCSAIGACGGKVQRGRLPSSSRPTPSRSRRAPRRSRSSAIRSWLLSNRPMCEAVYLARYREAEEALSQAPDDVEAPI